MVIMNIGIIGLGRMGHSIAYRLLKAGHIVVGFDLNPDLCNATQELGAQIAKGLDDIAQRVTHIWLMVPAGQAVDAVLGSMLPHLQAGTIIIDGGNSHFTDSIKRAHLVKEKGFSFLDCGTSGGLHGKDIGFSLMIGGDMQAYEKTIPLFAAIAMENGFGRVGSSGAGHYVKMVHNGIEYGLMQAYSEGFQLLKEGSYKDQNLDLAQITALWNHGAVIRSWLLELSHTIFTQDQNLTTISGIIEESGTGRWTVDDAHEHEVPVPIIEESLQIRAQSRITGGNYATKIVALLRHAFGGHKVLTK
jgi:6-phosphogluconate dehydrogenase